MRIWKRFVGWLMGLGLDEDGWCSIAVPAAWGMTPVRSQEDHLSSYFVHPTAAPSLWMVVVGGVCSFIEVESYRLIL